MNAKEFIKKFGWEEAKCRTEPNMIDMWDAGWGFYTSELKKYIDAYELVQSYGSLANAKNRCYPAKFIDINNYHALKQAITLIEEI